MTSTTKPESLYITGLAHEYPIHTMEHGRFEEFINTLYPDSVNSLALQGLLRFNRRTEILSRPTIVDYMKWTKADAEPPAIDELSLIFRTTGVDLTVSACTKALQEACLVASDVTHVVAVTCSDQSTPGYDLFVCQKLGLQPGVQRVMLQGVGCAGGLAALRAAADIAAAASQRGRPARILVFACELCSLFVRVELQAAYQDDETLHIAPALFSDAAAALVVCNGFAVGEKQKPIFEIMEGASMLVPETSAQMSSNVMKNGMIATITKDVPKIAVSAISPMFEQLRHTLGISNNPSPLARLQPAGFDWAIHPGGAAILRGAKQAMHLTDDHIRASLEIYRTRGNSSSPTVLVVLDSLRRMGRGRDNVVATSFGPGLTIEMCIMKRCRHDDQAQPSTPIPHGRMSKSWSYLHSILMRIGKRPAVLKSVD